MFTLLDANGKSVGQVHVLIEVGVTGTRYVVKQVIALTGITYLEPDCQLVAIANPVPDKDFAIAVAFDGNVVQAARLNPMQFTPSQTENDELEMWAVEQVHAWAVDALVF